MTFGQLIEWTERKMSEATADITFSAHTTLHTAHSVLTLYCWSSKSRIVAWWSCQWRRSKRKMSSVIVVLGLSHHVHFRLQTYCWVKYHFVCHDTAADSAALCQEPLIFNFFKCIRVKPVLSSCSSNELYLAPSCGYWTYLCNIYRASILWFVPDMDPPNEICSLI